MPFDLVILGEIAHGSIQHGIVAYEMWKQHHIAATVEKIAEELKKSDRRTLRRAYDHLESAANAGNRKSCEAELDHARAAFAEICAMEPEPGNELMIALGHYGSFCYFIALDDFANALHHVYKCTEKYPDIAVRMFPPEFFSKNYRQQIPQAQAKLERLRTRLKTEEEDQDIRIRARVSEQMRALMKHGAPPAPPAADEAGIQAAMRMRELRGEVDRAEAELRQLRQELAAECADWLKYLKRKEGAALTIDDFRKLQEKK